MSRSDDRIIEQWRFARDVQASYRSDTGQSSSGAADCARPSGWALFCRAVSITVQAIGLLILAAILLFWVVVADALVNTPEPETRTFDRPIDGTSYERTQREWEVTP